MGKKDKDNNLPWPVFLPKQTRICPECETTYPEPGPQAVIVRCGQCSTELVPLEQWEKENKRRKRRG